MALAIEEKMTHEGAVQLAEEIERVEASLRMMKRTLRDYVEEHGEVRTKDKVWRVNESVSWRISPEGLEKLKDWLVLDNKNPWEWFNITPANIRKLGWSEEVLEELGTRSIRRNFSGRKA